MNWMQRHAMKELTLHKDLKLADLLPEDVESNLFVYHLDKLVTEQYVQKKNRRYHLTAKGHRHVGLINSDTGQPRLQPKVVVMLIIKNELDEYLLWRWKRQPFYNQISFPYGKTDFGFSIDMNIHHELDTKIGARGTYSYIGDAYVKTEEQGTVVNHMLAHVFTVSNLSKTPRSLVPTGESFWARPESLNDERFAPGFWHIKDLIENEKRPFFQEIDVSY